MSPALDAGPDTTVPVARRAVRVVVVDDEPDTVTTLSTLLRMEGYEVKTATSGADALDLIGDFDPDAVILDIAMPGLSGWEVARKVRAVWGPDRPLLIAVSGEYKKGSDKLLAKMTGFNFYLTKPCDPNVLFNLLASLREGK